MLSEMLLTKRRHVNAYDNVIEPKFCHVNAF